ncbi:MAG: hypothetical protein H0V88_01850 [Pyrinomonadaceae bacterium]|nr:hypothetical protein [Pyrinomonadaceae bacterium]
MKQYTRIIRTAALGLLAPLVIIAAFAADGAAQTQGGGAGTTYRGASRDPFTPYRAPVRRKPSARATPSVISPPAIQERINSYKAQKAAAIEAQRPAPKPVTALLLSELQVIGIFRTPRGYAAMVEATPIKLSYVIYPGEMFYDGQLVAIEEGRLVFRRVTRWTNGKRETAVETKALRQQNTAATDSLTANGAATPKQ